MGRLVDGKWTKMSIIRSDKGGAYDRIPRSFRNQIASEQPVFKPESNRYHLYVSYACPWAHRTLIMRKLKSLQEHISVSVVHPYMLEKGWAFGKDFIGTTGDDLFDFDHLSQVYTLSDPKISTSVTVPVLWDKQSKQIVNNESSDIIRIFNVAFNNITSNTENYYPQALQEEIDVWNDYIYENLNNGVYRCGFAKSQAAYEQACSNLFKVLEKLDGHLSNNEYLVGSELTEADIRLIPTLLRFDLVYYHHFKCSKKPLVDFKYLYQYAKRLYAMPAINGTTNFEHIKHHYYYSHEEINPTRIVPIIDSTF
tara:strand:- start:17693 stop:18622 length:930 start_codon:yes stop_codon:yes gene_type:complete